MSNWKGRLRAAAVLALSVLMAVPGRTQIPQLGDGSDLTVGAERKLGESIARELYRDPDYLDDAVLDEYVHGIWQRLLAAARRLGELPSDLDQRFAWQVLIGKDREINAFALPGGWLGLNLGLISATASPDELASVLAHELSHVTQRHISRLMAQEQRTMPLVLVAMILGAMAAGKNTNAANAVITGGQALAIQNQLNFSRDMEREADRVGYGVMTEAGFRPQAFVTMFEKLQQAARLNDNGSFPYLRTHPMTTERMAEMQARQQLAPPPAGPPPADLVYAMMIGRARVLSYPGVDGLRSYVAEAQGVRAGGPASMKQVTVLYAGALANAKLREYPAAMRVAGELAALVAHNPAAAREAALLLAEIGLQAGDSTRALALVPGAGRPELLLSSQARIARGRAAEVAPLLRTWVAVHPRDAQAWQTLSRAYGAEGDRLRSIRADAEAQVAHLDYQAALDRFKAAQDLARHAGPGEYIEASIIDARTREVQSLLREQSLER
jgi:predicted Zn-dependent protease